MTVNTNGNHPLVRIGFVVVLWIAVIASGLAVVYATHLSRQKFAELDSLQRQTTELHVEWGQFLLEQSTWSAFDRVESLAVNQLDMRIPDSQQIVIVENQ